VLKHAVNVQLHALKSHKEDQFGGLLHESLGYGCGRWFLSF